MTRPADERIMIKRNVRMEKLNKVAYPELSRKEWQKTNGFTSDGGNEYMNPKKSGGCR
jgi:hypothetical protein